MMLTKEEAAAALDGCQYGEEGPRELFDRMKKAGLVAVFGASDDLIEFRGALNDEVGAYEGGWAYVTSDGLFEARCDNDACPYDRENRQRAVGIEALWDSGGFSWQYETAIQHAKFIVMEDDERYCEGIVFALADVPSTP